MAFAPALARALPRLGARAAPAVATRAPRRRPSAAVAAAASASASASPPPPPPSPSASPSSPSSLPSPPSAAAAAAATDAVTADTVQWVARLAHLRLTDAEAAGMVDVFGEMLAFVRQVSDADVSDIEAAAAVGGGGGGGNDDAAAVAAVAAAAGEAGVVDAAWLRPDEPVAFGANEELLAEAPALEDDLFRVPRIMDAEE